MKDVVIYYDLETTGLDWRQHRVIQFAGIACEGFQLRQLAELEVKIKIDEVDECDVKALLQHAGRRDFARKDEETDLQLAKRFAVWWDQQAISPVLALAKIDSFIQKYKCAEKVAKESKKKYLVARLAGQNIHAFDNEFMRQWYKRADKFFPASFHSLDLYHLACWTDWALNGCRDIPLNLPAMRERYNINTGMAHDALADVRATVEVTRRVLFDLARAMNPDRVLGTS